MSTLKIQVGASLDRSTMSVFRQLADTAKRARTEIDQAERKSADQTEARYRRLSREAERWARQEATARKAAAREAEQEAKRAAREIEAANDRAARKAIALLREQAREQRKVNEVRAAEATRIARDRSELRDRALSGVLGGTTSLGGRALRFAGSVGADLAAGYGVDTSLASYFQKNARLETMSVQLSNAAYQPGAAGANGVRQDPAKLRAEAFRIGTNTGVGANEVMEAMGQWTSITGDLETGRGVMERLAMLSKATGSSMADMASAAANASNQLGDMPDKAFVVDRVMRQIAGQGKLGAVEIKDLATQMAKVAASAGLIEGDKGKNIQTLGILAQEARAQGGAPTAQGAATAVGSFMNTFSKGARLDAFKHYGVQTQGEGGLTRSPEEIIIAALRASVSGGRGVAGSNRAMGEMFADAKSRQVTRGFEKLFLGAYAGEKGSEEAKLAAGTKAVTEEFERLRRAAMEEEELQTSFAAAMSTGESQANSFNNAMQEAVGQAQNELLPAFKALAPAAISAAGAVANWAAQTFGLPHAAEPVTKGDKDVDKLLVAENRAIGQGAGGKVDARLVDKADETIKRQRQNVRELRAQAAGRREDASSWTGALVGFVGGMYEAGVGTGRYADASRSKRFGAIMNYRAGWEGVAENKANQNNVATAEEKQADEAAAKLDMLNKTNEEMRDLLKRGILVKLDQPKALPGPAAKAPPASNMPTAEE